MECGLNTCIGAIRQSSQLWRLYLFMRMEGKGGFEGDVITRKADRHSEYRHYRVAFVVMQNCSQSLLFAAYIRSGR